MRLWLQRHAPVRCEPGTCYGASDLPADPADTAEAARRIAAVLPPGLRLWSSPLVRCRVLADAIGALRPDLPPARLDARLAEMDFGAWEGRPWAGIAPAELAAWTDDFTDARPGATGERVRDFMARVGGAWDDWRGSGQDALWLTHAGVMRAVRLIQNGQRLPATARDWPGGAIGFGDWVQADA